MDKHAHSSSEEPKPTKASLRPSEPLPPHPAFATIVKVRHSRRPLWIALAIIVVVAASYSTYYWQHQKLKTAQSQKTTAEQMITSLNTQVAELQKSTTTPSKNVLTVPELGIEVTVPSKLSDMTYAVLNETAVAGHSNTSIGLSTLGLITLDPKCNAAQAPLGTLSKTAGKYPAIPTINNSSGQLLTQYSTYYLAYEAPQTACSSSTTTQSQEITDIGLLPKWSTAIQLLQ